MLTNTEGDREIYCVDIDLTKHKQAEIELSRANETNQALINAIPDLIIRVSRDGLYLGSIGANEIEFAIPLENLIGKRISDVLEPQLAQERMYLVEQAFITGKLQFHEYRINVKDEFRCEEARIAVSGENEAIILIRDITDRKNAELALQESEARYRLLSENTNDLVCLHQPDGRYTYVSPSCETLLGYSYDEMIGRDPYSLFHPDDCEHLLQNIHTQALQGKSVPSTYRIRQKSGNYIWFETLTKPIRDKNGVIIQLQTTSRDVTERIQTQTKLAYDSLHDALTGLPNRQLLSERLELAIHRIHRHDSYRFAVLFLDLDRFKIVNDSLGHLVGDRLLIAIAQQLKRTFREIDLIARIGGDEFVVLLEDIQDIQEAVHATQRLLNSLQVPLILGDRQVYTSCSVGIVFGSTDYHQASELLRDADIAMYRAKSQGKSRYEIFDTTMHRQALIRMNLENDLRQAIEIQAFSLHYQPLVCLRTGKLLGFEALIRWHHPTQGWKSPNEFIPVAEEMGIIHQLSHWVLREACRQLVTWHKTFPEFSDLKVNVNLSSQDLQHPDLIEQIDQVIAQTQFPPHLLTIEITERMVIENVEATIATLTKLRTRGLEISIDDFGTGYSSLSYLHLLPITSVKVDRSFVNQMTDSNKNYRIVETIATLSHQLGIQSISEGIETLPQLIKLKELHYLHGQGFLFARPLDVLAVEKLLSKKNLYLFADLANSCCVIDRT
ncbi:MAG: response regulator receiver protein [Pseudanabaena sp.]|nr:MAG: response regulator receiver protein [Pseudanabaena sp.]